MQYLGYYFGPLMYDDPDPSSPLRSWAFICSSDLVTILIRSFTCSMLIGNVFNTGAMRREILLVRFVTRYVILHLLLDDIWVYIFFLMSMMIYHNHEIYILEHLWIVFAHQS